MQTIPEILAEELGQRQDYVENVITLLDEGNTVPFIARYRKEMHGAMDDQAIRNLADRLDDGVNDLAVGGRRTGGLRVHADGDTVVELDAVVGSPLDIHAIFLSICDVRT